MYKYFKRATKIALRKFVLFVSLPLLRYCGYKKQTLKLGLPESHYFRGEDSLGSLNQIHKRYLKQTGWVESKNSNQSVRFGKFIPWTSYSFTHWIEKKNFKTSNILEFGSGASTMYWATKFARVLSIESDLNWFEKMQSATIQIANVTVCNLWTDDSSSHQGEIYSKAKSVFEMDLKLFPELNLAFKNINFDLVYKCVQESSVFFVDGGPRNLYMYLLSEWVDDSAVIFVDNSDQLYTSEGRNLLTLREFKEIEFNSLGPLNHSATSTSIFIKNLNSL